MGAIWLAAVALSFTGWLAQTVNLQPATAEPTAAATAKPTGPLDWVCPMDRDVRSDQPGVCPRCGMTLVLGIPDEAEYPMTLSFSPKLIRAGQKERLLFQIHDPKTGKQVDRFQVVHEKLFHMFMVSQDLSYFLHDHPVEEPGGAFHFDAVFPKPGMYRVVADVYPEGGTPQLIARTVIVPETDRSLPPLAPAKLAPSLGPQHAANIDVELTTEPSKPIAGMKTLLFFKIKPAEGLEKYLGAWGHMLAASDDLVDMIHTHPFLTYGGDQIQFNLIFPRARTYRIWVQFQRKGVVNTVEFTVPVADLD
ncbi:MAG TPA: heavy metal-binding domain-containing protein [Bryobacteraceae bacterium]|jgi:hypothetical protein|nr:heavy metal-binding domain-containing protein [Bryobacteraceae bacterium]